MARAPGSRPITPGGSSGSSPLFSAPARELGLSTVVALALALVVALVGVVFDLVTGRDLRTVSAVCFVLGCGAATFLVRRSGLRTLMLAPPLLYSGLLLLTSLVRGVVPRTIPRQAVELLTRLVLGAPVLVAAVLVAVVLGVLRGAFRRR